MLVVLALLILAGLAVKFHFDINGNEKAMASLITARDQALRNLELSKNEGIKLQKALRHSKDLLKQLEGELNKLESGRDSVPDVVNSEEMENELDRWLGVFEKFQNYIKNNPGYAIPEFKYLSSKDWLRLTQGKMETDADYRKTLGLLRMQSLIYANGILCQAIRDFSTAHNGGFPQTYEDVRQYLPADFDYSRYVEVPPGENPSGPTGGPPPGNTRWILKDIGPVDPLWDSALWVSAKGATRIPPINFGPADMVSAAIKEYENANGSAPTSSSQIGQYIKYGDNAEIISEADIDAIYKSLTTPVQ